jgi:hypothetical protein
MYRGRKGRGAKLGSNRNREGRGARKGKKSTTAVREEGLVTEGKVLEQGGDRG